MAEAIDIYGTAFKNGSVTLMARVVGNNGAHIVPVDITTAKYSVYLLDDRNPDSRTPVTGHAQVALTVSAILFASLQTGPFWTIDGTGYNFRHTLDVSTDPAFATAGRRYLVEYQLNAAAGQVILLRFRLNVI